MNSLAPCISHFKNRSIPTPLTSTPQPPGMKSSHRHRHRHRWNQSSISPETPCVSVKRTRQECCQSARGVDLQEPARVLGDLLLLQAQPFKISFNDFICQELIRSWHASPTPPFRSAHSHIPSVHADENAFLFSQETASSSKQMRVHPPFPMCIHTEWPQNTSLPPLPLQSVCVRICRMQQRFIDQRWNVPAYQCSACPRRCRGMRPYRSICNAGARRVLRAEYLTNFKKSLTFCWESLTFRA